MRENRVLLTKEEREEGPFEPRDWREIVDLRLSVPVPVLLLLQFYLIQIPPPLPYLSSLILPLPPSILFNLFLLRLLIQQSLYPSSPFSISAKHDGCHERRLVPHLQQADYGSLSPSPSLLLSSDSQSSNFSSARQALLLQGMQESQRRQRRHVSGGV